MSKTIEADIERERSFPMSEIGVKEIETDVANLNIDAEAFAEEILTIRVATNAADATPVHTSVNGVNQYILRGRKQQVKRKYVEALSRAKVYTYAQELGDMRDPSSLRMVERTNLAYPFEVLHDPNPKGYEWLERILAS